MQDLEAMAYFEAATHQQASKPSQITIHRIPESNFMKQVVPPPPDCPFIRS